MLTHNFQGLPQGINNPKLIAQAVEFNSKDEVHYNEEFHLDEPFHPCILHNEPDDWMMNLFTLDAIVSESRNRIVHLNQKIYKQIPTSLTTKASAEDLHQHLHRHGQLQVRGISSFNIARCRTSIEDGNLKVTWGDGSASLTYTEPADILMINLAVQSFDIVGMLGAYNFSWLQQWIRHRVACCIPCTTSTYFPIFSCIEQLAQHILTACARVPETHKKEREDIVEACQNYIQTHHTFLKDLQTKVGQKTLFTFKVDMQTLQEVVNDTLLELLSIDSKTQAWAQEWFLTNCRISHSNEESLLEVFDQVLNDDIVHPSQPIIKYHSLNDITCWESYCTYCREYNIILYPYTVHQADMEAHPILFHLINRIIIENALALHDEGKGWYDWQKLQDTYAIENDFLDKRSEEILSGVNSIRDFMHIPHWDSPFDIDFQELWIRYDALSSDNKRVLKSKLNLNNKHFHQYINFAEFAIESARLGYFRIPAPIPSKRPPIKKVLQIKIDELTKDCPSHKELFIQRLFLLTPLITLLEVL